MDQGLPTTRDLLTSLLDSIDVPPQSLVDESVGGNIGRQTTDDDESIQKKALLTLHVLFPHELLPALDLLDRGCVTRLDLSLSPLHSEEGDYQHNDSRSSTQDRLQENNVSSRQSTEQPQPPAPLGRRTSRTTRTQSVYYVRSARQHRQNQPQPQTQQRQYHQRTVNPSSTAATPSLPTPRTRSPPSASSIMNAPNYEVRLQAWSCSCPAFPFSAFPVSTAAADVGSPDEDGNTSAAAAEPSARQTHSFTEAVAEQNRRADGRDRWRVGGLSSSSPYSASKTVGGSEDRVPMCKHLLACVLAERTQLFAGFVETREVSVDEWVGWAAGWGD